MESDDIISKEACRKNNGARGMPGVPMDPSLDTVLQNNILLCMVFVFCNCAPQVKVNKVLLIPAELFCRLKVKNSSL